MASEKDEALLEPVKEEAERNNVFALSSEAASNELRRFSNLDVSSLMPFLYATFQDKSDPALSKTHTIGTVTSSSNPFKTSETKISEEQSRAIPVGEISLSSSPKGNSARAESSVGRRMLSSESSDSSLDCDEVATKNWILGS